MASSDSEVVEVEPDEGEAREEDEYQEIEDVTEEEDADKNLDEILDELKEDDGDLVEVANEDDEHVEEHEDGEEEDSSKQEGDKNDKEESKSEVMTEHSKAEDVKEAPIDPAKGFLENEQDKMISGSWKYRMKITSFDFESREMNHDNIEKLVNISLSAAVYFYKKNKVSGRKLGKMEIFCNSQTTGQMAIEKSLRLNVNRPLSIYIMRKVNLEEKELAFLKLYPRNAHQMHYIPTKRQRTYAEKPSTRSVLVDNVPEGTSEELLQALFPCAINIMKQEENKGESTGYAILECVDKYTAIAILRSYLKVQISMNVLPLSLCEKSKEASNLIDEADKKKKEEARQKEQEARQKEKEAAKSEGEKAKSGEEGSEKDKDEGKDEEKRGKSSDRKSSHSEEKFRKPSYDSYHSNRGSYHSSRGSRYAAPDPVSRETKALREQISLLQENISLLTENMIISSQASKRSRTDSGRVSNYSSRDDYSSSRYNSRDYGSSHSGSYSWSGGQRSSSSYDGGSRKRPYSSNSWDDDYSSGRSYKKYY